MNIDSYNLEVFKFIRQEIDNRVQMHYRLIMWKLGLGFGILSFLLSNKNVINDTQFSPFFLVAIFLMLMDIIIVENLGHIRSSGEFIKKNIENYKGDEKIIRWESDFALLGNNWSCFTLEGYLLGIWSVSVVLIILGLFEYSLTISLLNLNLFIFSLFFLIVSFLAIFGEISSGRKCNIKVSESSIK